MRDGKLNKKRGQRQSLPTLTFHIPIKNTRLLLEIYFKEAPLVRASLMFPTR